MGFSPVTTTPFHYHLYLITYLLYSDINLTLQSFRSPSNTPSVLSMTNLPMQPFWVVRAATSQRRVTPSLPFSLLPFLHLLLFST